MFFVSIIFCIFFLIFSVQTQFLLPWTNWGENSMIFTARNDDGQVDCARHIPPELENTLLMLRWWGFRVRVGGWGLGEYGKCWRLSCLEIHIVYYFELRWWWISLEIDILYTSICRCKGCRSKVRNMRRQRYVARKIGDAIRTCWLKEVENFYCSQATGVKWMVRGATKQSSNRQPLTLPIPLGELSVHRHILTPKLRLKDHFAIPLVYFYLTKYWLFWQLIDFIRACFILCDSFLQNSNSQEADAAVSHPNLQPFPGDSASYVVPALTAAVTPASQSFPVRCSRISPVQVDHGTSGFFLDYKET